MTEPEPDYDAIARSGVLPTFEAKAKPPVPTGNANAFDREHLDRLHGEWDEAMGRWVDYSVTDGSAESLTLKKVMDERCREFTRAFAASVPAGTRLTFKGYEFWHYGDSGHRLQCGRTKERTTDDSEKT